MFYASFVCVRFLLHSHELAVKNRILFLPILAVAIALAGCASLTRGTAPTSPTTTIRVENQGFLDMTVYVMRSAERVRLGLVPGGGTSNFVIPPDLPRLGTPLRFVADPVGATRASVSDEITVQPGDQVTMVIPPS
jgi:hypothetical protein